MKTFKYLFFLILLGSLASCSTGPAENAPEDGGVSRTGEGMLLSADQQKAAGIVVEPVEERTVRQTIKANGMLDVPTQYRASVTTFVGSFVKGADKHVGEKVTRGQVLATMEGPAFIDLQQQYLESKTQLDLLQADFERQRSLSADSISSRKSFEKAKAEFERTQSVVESLRRKLMYARIDMARLESGTISPSFPVVAPISGYLTEVNARIGGFVSPGESLMEIVDLSHLHVELAVYETDAMKVKEGQQMNIWLPSRPDSVFEAEIYLVDKEFDMESRTVKVHGHFEEDQPFIVGMYVEGEIVLGETKGVAIPATAAVFAGMDRYVFLATDRGEQGVLFRPVQVKEGAESGGVLLLDAATLPQGFDKVVTKGAGYLLGEWMREE